MVGLVGKSGGPPGRERAHAPLITLPIALIALLRFEAFNVHLSRAGGGSSVWYFRFSPKAILQVNDDGAWCWRLGNERWRLKLAPMLARAEALSSRWASAAALAGDCAGGDALRRAASAYDEDQLLAVPDLDPLVVGAFPEGLLGERPGRQLAPGLDPSEVGPAGPIVIDEEP
jgi:hypothetical protein